MALCIEITINHAASVGSVYAIRTHGSTDPDSIGTYRIDHGERTVGTLTHRYGDGGLVLAHKALGLTLRLAPQAHVRGQERPKPANVGTGEGAGLEGAQIGARETKPERPREGE